MGAGNADQAGCKLVRSCVTEQALPDDSDTSIAAGFAGAVQCGAFKRKENSMSQYPPPGAPTPPPNFNAPGAPIPPPNYTLSGAKRSNGAAIGSLICGILLCVPVITGLLAVILGIVGLRKTRDPQVGGKGMSIAGIILGILGLVGWGASGAKIASLFHGTGPQREVARQFLVDLSNQNVSAAQAKASTNLSPQSVQALADKVKPWGTLQDTMVFAARTPAANEASSVGGVATFSTGQHSFNMIVVKENGQWKIDHVDFNN